MKEFIKELKEFLKEACESTENLKSMPENNQSYLKGRLYSLDMVYNWIEDYEKKHCFSGIDKQIIDKKIIGYKAPFDMFNGIIKQGELFAKHLNANKYSPFGLNSNHFLTYELPSEIVEKWEAVYEEEKKEESKLPKKKYTKRDMVDFSKYVITNFSNPMTPIELFKAWKSQRS